MKKQIFKAVSGLAVAALVTSAQAIPTLTIFDGTTTIVVTDNGAGDIAPAAGVVVWTGTIGVWDINVDTGTTKPAFGSPTSPYMDLAFVAGSTRSGGQLTLTFSEDGWDFAGTLSDTIGGTAANAGAAGTVVDNVFVGTTLVASIGPLGPGGFLGSTTAGVVLTPQDLLSIQVVITHQGRGLTTGDKEVTGVPDGGATVVLLGAALAGLGLARRKLIA